MNQSNCSRTRLLAVGITALCTTLFFGYIPSASAATMVMSPSATQVKVGDTFTIRVSVNTQGKAVNNAEATVSFPNDLVEIKSVGTQGSVFSLWVEQPNFSNSESRMSFNGGVPNPGYTGSGGLVVTISFKAKKAGTAAITFASAAIRENDGLGTNIFSGQADAAIEIVDTTKPIEPKEPTKPEEPKQSQQQTTPLVRSTTHPDQNAWYRSPDVTMVWTLPAGSTAVQTSISTNAGAQPSVIYRPPIFKKQLSSLADGVWYFAARSTTGTEWSKTVRYRLQIDTQAPENVRADRADGADGRAGILLRADDQLSGIASYLVVVDSQPGINVDAKVAKDAVQLPLLSLGMHEMSITAYDAAGNSSQARIPLSIEPALAPIITKSSESITLGQRIQADGTTVYSGATVVVVLTDSIGVTLKSNVVSDASGGFSYTSDPISAVGTYKLTAYVLSGTGVASPSSPVYPVTVQGAQRPAAAPVIQKGFDNYTKALVGLIGLLAFLVIIMGYRIFVLRNKLSHAEGRANRAYKLLFDKAHHQLAVLEKSSKKRKLTRDEMIALDSLREVIEHIEDIEKSKK